MTNGIRGPIPQRILIVLMGAIGDVIRALPLLGRIRRAWPDAYIGWAVEPKSEPLLRSHRWVNKLIVYDRKYAPWSFVSFMQKIHSERFDLVLDLQRHLKSGFISMISRAPERLGFAPANSKEFNHLFATRHIAVQPRMRLKLLQYQAFADALSLPAAPIEFGFELPPAEDSRARGFVAGVPRPMIGVILGSSWRSRIYFPESIAEVIRGLTFPVEGKRLAGFQQRLQAAQYRLPAIADFPEHLAARLKLIVRDS